MKSPGFLYSPVLNNDGPDIYDLELFHTPGYTKKDLNKILSFGIQKNLIPDLNQEDLERIEPI